MRFAFILPENDSRRIKKQYYIFEKTTNMDEDIVWLWPLNYVCVFFFVFMNQVNFNYCNTKYSIRKTKRSRTGKFFYYYYFFI